MTLKKFTKTPGERKRYVLDYADWLDTGETITSVTFEVTPDDLSALEVDAYLIGTPATTVGFFVNHGVAGTSYEVTATIVTSGGQSKEDQLLYVVRSL